MRVRRARGRWTGGHAARRAVGRGAIGVTSPEQREGANSGGHRPRSSGCTSGQNGSAAVAAPAQRDSRCSCWYPAWFFPTHAGCASIRMRSRYNAGGGQNVPSAASATGRIARRAPEPQRSAWPSSAYCWKRRELVFGRTRYHVGSVRTEGCPRGCARGAQLMSLIASMINASTIPRSDSVSPLRPSVPQQILVGAVLVAVGTRGGAQLVSCALHSDPRERDAVGPASRSSQMADHGTDLGL